ncbi:collagen alpha-1(I) chain-like [Candoia aspera]|uniref:collagen alpha-1(I) chain-like n=1 Tax=Candoia aspera TaxID=51853 RepID=UPI002FD824CC
MCSPRKGEAEATAERKSSELAFQARHKKASEPGQERSGRLTETASALLRGTTPGPTTRGIHALAGLGANPASKARSAAGAGRRRPGADPALRAPSPALRPPGSTNPAKRHPGQGGGGAPGGDGGAPPPGGGRARSGRRAGVPAAGEASGGGSRQPDAASSTSGFRDGRSRPPCVGPEAHRPPGGTAEFLPGGALPRLGCGSAAGEAGPEQEAPLGRPRALRGGGRAASGAGNGRRGGSRGAGAGGPRGCRGRRARAAGARAGPDRGRPGGEKGRRARAPTAESRAPEAAWGLPPRGRARRPARSPWEPPPGPHGAAALLLRCRRRRRRLVTPQSRLGRSLLRMRRDARPSRGRSARRESGAARLPAPPREGGRRGKGRGGQCGEARRARRPSSRAPACLGGGMAAGSRERSQLGWPSRTSLPGAGSASSVCARAPGSAARSEQRGAALLSAGRISGLARAGPCASPPEPRLSRGAGTPPLGRSRYRKTAFAPGRPGGPLPPPVGPEAYAPRLPALAREGASGLNCPRCRRPELVFWTPRQVRPKSPLRARLPSSAAPPQNRG